MSTVRRRGWALVMTAGLVTQGLCASCHGEAASSEQPSYINGPQARGGEGVATAPVITPTAVTRVDPSEREVDEAIARAPQDPMRPSALMIAAERARLRVSPSEPSSSASRSHMLRALRALVADHPRYARADEVLFRLAEGQQGDDMTDARRSYLTLIQRFPTSRFVSFAYLAFAELFRRSADLDSSRQFYEQVARSSQSPELVAYATYRVGRVHVAQSRCAAGLQALTSARQRAGASQEVVDAAAADIGALGPCSPGVTLADREVSVPQPPLTTEAELTADPAASGPK